ncbi:hypothetical protein BH23CHL10_BH23CHL10_06670 [soil metagenome]
MAEISMSLLDTRNAQDLVPRSARSMIASAIRMVFEQPDGRAAREQLDRVIDGVRPRFDAVAELLTSAEPDLLDYFASPRSIAARSAARIRSSQAVALASDPS